MLRYLEYMITALLLLEFALEGPVLPEHAMLITGNTGTRLGVYSVWLRQTTDEGECAQSNKGCLMQRFGNDKDRVN
jgi:hypothetical protein